MHSVFIPADVPSCATQEFITNYHNITNQHGRLLLFAGDQKIEHLHTSFYGPGIDKADQHPEHLFAIAQQVRPGACALPLGLISRYGANYPEARYIVKMNAKTNLLPKETQDPVSLALWSLEDVLTLKAQTNLAIAGIGYTVYLGSSYENAMLQQAAHLVYQAHQHGLVAILWMYPRGKAIAHDRNGMLIAGAAGVANALGADFAKINVPDGDQQHTSQEWLSIAVQAAGNTKLICSGGPYSQAHLFIAHVQEQIQAGCGGIALGRNLHQRSLAQAQQLIKDLLAVL